ncbi:MAG: carbohydrate ABC transporter permease [Anaerolineaceae bacterium]|jgi:ABC-type glycerol-3-phosphate transport system permease component|nr:carbohydrate ABC transporter permease [Anaerolineaceae bacterium]
MSKTNNFHYKRSSRSPRRGFSLGKTVVYLVLSLFALSTILAFIWIIMISLKTTPEFLTTSPWALPEDPQFGNYLVAWEKAKIGTYFGNSIFVSLVGASVSVMVSALAAYVLARVPFKLNGFFRNYFLVGYMIPLFLTFIPLYFMMAKIGLNSGMLPLIMLYVASGVPFNTFILRGFFESLPSELEDAATVDGASPFRTFWIIMLPLSWPGLVSAFLINFMSLWNEFFLALLFLNKENATMPLGLFYMAQRAEYTSQWTDLFAGMIISTVPILIIFALLQDQITHGMTEGAIKG